MLLGLTQQSRQPIVVLIHGTSVVLSADRSCHLLTTDETSTHVSQVAQHQTMKAFGGNHCQLEGAYVASHLTQRKKLLCRAKRYKSYSLHPVSYTLPVNASINNIHYFTILHNLPE